MKTVAKYNTCKAISTVLTVGTPIATLACSGDIIVETSGKSVSAAAVFAFLLSLLFVKDKLLEFVKSPTALKVAIIGFVFCVVVGDLIETLKIVFGLTIAASALDELTFKKIYTSLMYQLPENYKQYEKFGFLFTTSSKLFKDSDVNE